MSGPKRVIVIGSTSTETIRRAVMMSGAATVCHFNDSHSVTSLPPPSLSDIAITRPDTSREDEEATLKRVGQAGKCRHCGKWQTNVWNHETNTCEKRFRRKR